MACAVCGRPYHAQRRPFLCAVDARNRLYEPRIAHAVVLLQSEQLEAQVNADLEVGAAGAAGLAGTAGTADKNPDGGGQRRPSARSLFEAWEAERQRALDRAGDVAARADRLRDDLDAARRALERRREGLRQRRSDLAAATNGTAARRARLQADVERSMAMTRFKWNQSYEAMAATRAFLCMEASKLYGLRCLKKGSGLRYELGGFEVVDPYNMNIISTSLAHITHILMLACHYLSIRLPAEITPPHRDYPRPTIFSLASSYAHGEVPFPGTAGLHPASPSLAAGGFGGGGGGTGRDLFLRVPRARPLFVDKALPLLAKEDGAAHTMFLEGIALLAYNIAWACCSQGVPIASGGDKASFDDVFSMGRNLYNLLIGNQLLNNPAGRIFLPPAAAAAAGGNSSSGGGGGGGGGDQKAPPAASMGRYAHGTTHTFLSDSVVQGFKIPSPNRLTDRLKTKLSSESTMPDWEVVDGDAWAVDDEDSRHMEDGVLPPKRGGSSSGGAAGGPAVGGRVPEKRLFGVESVATVLTALDDPADPADQGDRGADLAGPRPRLSPRAANPDRPPKSGGTSGWTKLRNR